MGKIRNPILFSKIFGTSRRQLNNIGILDPTLNVDTPLFIDPLLLPFSNNKLINKKAKLSFRKYFENIISVLQNSKSTGDFAWRNAERLLTFHEVKGTCLGYGITSVSGRAFGRVLRTRLLTTAKDVIDLGVKDPDLFPVMALLEEGIGPDLISDMTTNVIIDELFEFTENICNSLGIKVDIFEKRYKAQRVKLPRNPFFPKKNVPVIFVPLDILRTLPISKDWDSILDATWENEELRERVNRLIGMIWQAKTKKDKMKVKEALKKRVLTNKEAFETLLAMIKTVEPVHYDSEADPSGHVFWRRLIDEIAAKAPLSINIPSPQNEEQAYDIVSQIINQFSFLIEKRRLSTELYHEGRPRHESAAQKLFFAVALSYCRANHVDVTPEAETGNGPVDFKFSSGFSGRILVEIKLSTNKKILAGYTKQLRKYMEGEETNKGFYVVIDVGNMGEKDQKLIKIKNEYAGRGISAPEIIFINGEILPSASKLV
ncbi:MAG: hypothetical protein AB1814_08735 [Thermodesulfobacteriota bacterium]